MAINFSNPHFLPLIPLLASIPFILEISGLRKPKRREISSIILVLGARKHVRGWKVPKSILLALRALILSFIALSLSGPKISGPHKVEGICVVAIDRSMSMGYIEEGEKAIERAKVLAQEIASCREKVVLLVFDERAEELSNGPIESKHISELLKGIEPSYRATKPGSLVLVVEKLRRELGKNVPVYLISDFRGKVWRKVKGDLFIAVPVSKEEPPKDCSIIHVEPSNPYPFPMFGFELLVRFRTYGINKCRISVQLDGSKISEMEVVGGIGDKEVRFPMTISKPGWHTGFVTIKPSGLLPEGDKAFFSLYVRPYLTVSLIGDNIYLEKALNPFEEKDWYLRFKKVRDPRNAGKNDILVVSDIGSMDEESFVALKRRLEGGGKAIIFCGGRIREGDIPSWICGGKIIGKSREKKGLGIQDYARSHKALRIFSDPRNGNIMITKFYEILMVKITDPNAHPLVFLQNDLPAMIEIPVGRGALIFFPFALDPSKTDLPLKPFFPPLLHELIKYLVGDEGIPELLPIGGEVGRAISIPSLESDSFEILDPLGRRTEASGQSFRFVPEFPGIYRIVRKNGELVLVLAFNVPHRELDLERISNRELRNIGFLGYDSSFLEGKEIDLTPPLILSLALLILAESVVTGSWRFRY